MNEKYSITLLHNTRPAPSLHRTFLRRKSQKKNRSENKMATRRSPFTRLEIIFLPFRHLPNQRVLFINSFMEANVVRSMNRSCLQVTAPNGTEVEWPFYEHCHMVLHVTRRLLLQLLASVLSSHVRF